MNKAQKRVAGLTIVLILAACSSLSGQTTLTTGERFVSYLSSNGHLHMLYAPSGSGWKDLDLYAQVSFCPVAAAGSAVTSVVDNLDLVHIYYVTTTNEICEFLINGITSAGFTGRVNEPTTVSGAPVPAAGSALSAIVDTSSGSSDYIHVFYEGTNGNIYEMFYDGSDAIGTVYTFYNPTSLAGGAPIATSGSALTSFFDGGAMHVFYLGTNNNVYELYWVSGTAWHSDDPTTLASGAPVATSGSALTGFADGSGFMHVFYSSGQNVHELYWTGGGTWHTDDSTTQAGAPSNAVGTALTSFDNTTGLGDTGMHVMGLGTTAHVDALHSTSSPSWAYFDATAASGGVPAASGSKLTSFRDTVTGGVRLYFLGTNSHVYELYWPTEGSSSETDITAASGTTATAASGSKLAGVMEPN